MTAEHYPTTGFEGSLYESPTPWGPWTFVDKWFNNKKNYEWYGNYQPGIITKGLGSNTFYFTASGVGEDPSHPYGNYRFKIGKITMILNK